MKIIEPSVLLAVALMVACSGCDRDDVPGMADERPPADAQSLREIVARLEESGYTPIREVDFDDGHWEVEAYQEGAAVELHVDPLTGEIESQVKDEGEVQPPADAKPLSEILMGLKEAGYSSFDEVSFEGDTWEIEASRDNTASEFRVDPTTGEVVAE